MKFLILVASLALLGCRHNVCVEEAPAQTTYIPMMVGKIMLLEPVTTYPCLKYKELDTDSQ